MLSSSQVSMSIFSKIGRAGTLPNLTSFLKTTQMRQHVTRKVARIHSKTLIPWLIWGYWQHTQVMVSWYSQGPVKHTADQLVLPILYARGILLFATKDPKHSRGTLQTLKMNKNNIFAKCFSPDSNITYLFWLRASFKAKTACFDSA